MSISSKKEIITEEEFNLLRELIEKNFGIVVRGDKRLTFHTKVSHRLVILGLRNYREYYDYIVSEPTGEELYELASHITNNETYFFRERNQLDLFSNILPDIKRDKQKLGSNTLRILSLAASSGEEAYTLNMLVNESMLFLWDWDVRITGIDIDKKALARAEAGCYSQNSFRGVNGAGPIMEKYLVQDGDHRVIKKSLSKNVRFMFGNILDPELFTKLEPADVVFCRNVFIYLSPEALDRAIRNLHSVVSDNGYLFIGSSESLIQKTNLFLPQYHQGVIVYRKNPGIGGCAPGEEGEPGK